MDTLKQCLTTAPVLRTFDSGRRSVVTTYVGKVAIAAGLTQPATTILWRTKTAS